MVITYAPVDNFDDVGISNAMAGGWKMPLLMFIYVIVSYVPDGCVICQSLYCGDCVLREWVYNVSDIWWTVFR